MIYKRRRCVTLFWSQNGQKWVILAQKQQESSPCLESTCVHFTYFDPNLDKMTQKQRIIGPCFRDSYFQNSRLF